MAKRVSMKGKGADLFFDGLDPADATMLTVVESTDAHQRPNSNDLDPANALNTSASVISEMAVSVSPSLTPTAPEPRSRRSRTHASTSASALASTPASEPPTAGAASVDPTVIEGIRKIVKHPGKEVSFVRLSPEEKGKLADIVYTYKRQGTKTTENEINRIAVNYLLADYYATGERSILAQVIAALRA